MSQRSPEASCRSGRIRTRGTSALRLLPAALRQCGIRVIVACARFCARHAIRWDRLLQAAITHGVAPLVGTNLEKAQASALLLPRKPSSASRWPRSPTRDAEGPIGSAGRRSARFSVTGDRSPCLLIKGLALDHLVYQTALAQPCRPTSTWSSA